MNSKQAFNIPYTIGFCLLDDMVLMLHRKFPPNQHLWNGVGGKIHKNESPDDAMIRELLEETTLDIKQAESMQYIGIVKWNVVGDESNSHKGMYAYIIRFSSRIEWSTKMTDEGLLEWKKLDWVIDKANHQVADNIPYFLPYMLETSVPLLYDFHYIDGVLDKLTVYSLDKQE